MACQVMHSWTFTGLVGAFLDLAIAYLLLCASTLVFFASKLLGFFGLCLPCHCSGLFGTPNRTYCVQRLLVDSPIESVSSVQLSVKSKFPFDSIWPKDRDYQLNLKLITDIEKKCVNGVLEMEGEASYGSFSGFNMGERNLVSRNESVKEGRFDSKGKGNENQRPNSRLRRRQKICLDYAKVSCGDAKSHSSTNHNGNNALECSSLPIGSRADADRFNDDETPSIKNFGEKASKGIEFSESLYEYQPYEENESSFEETKSNVQIQLDEKGNEQNAIRILEQPFEEENAARAALFLEIEKERNAAASAADEAKAMLLRLQEEKASVEMEARQYQRIMEEKSSYDAEEMNILKEILVRRELEKHFLEKEVEAYRHMYNGIEQSIDDIPDTVNTQRDELASSLDMHEDPFLMLRQLSGSIDKDIGEDETLVHVVDVYENNEPLLRESDLELDASEVEKKNGIRDFPSANGFGMKPNISRSYTSTTAGLPPLGGSSRKSIISDVRKNFMSAVDTERLKIYTEVEWVREKLRTVQGGRERLNFFQLQLLEDIAGQLREI